MLIESNKPLVIRLTDRDIHLAPGQSRELPDDVAEKVLAKVPSVVRVIVRSDEDALSLFHRTVEWESQRFGHRIGQVVLASSNGWCLVLNGKTGGLTWVREDLLYAAT